MKCEERRGNEKKLEEWRRKDLKDVEKRGKKRKHEEMGGIERKHKATRDETRDEPREMMTSKIQTYAKLFSYRLV